MERIMWRRHWGGPEGRGERMFEKGEFKYLILDLLQQQPGHGYELIRRLEERSGGHYAPSPGVVYPTLQMLEDMGCVAVTQESGRKVYAITEEGRRVLAEHGARVDDIREHMHRWHDTWHGERFHDPLHALRDLKQFMSNRGRGWDLTPDKARRIGEVITRARRDIEAILAERPSDTVGAAPHQGPSDSPRAPGSGPVTV
jgi:DNA-binding PadR family transcriptional regulator